MIFDSWPKEDLVQYLEFLLHHYRVMDAFWFLGIEKDYGIKEACRFNENVWGKVSALAARDLKKRFPADQGGLANFVKLQKLFPWSMLVGYQYEETTKEVIIKVPSCPAQTARLERGLGEYPCREMHEAEFKGFAREVDPRIMVECLFAPPEKHPADLFCKWRFTLAG